MDGFDLACLWIGRIVLCGSAILVALCFVALLVLKLVERVFGRDEVERRQKTAERLVGLLEWHEERMVEDGAGEGRHRASGEKKSD